MDITPTWEAILPTLLDCYTSKMTSREDVLEELQRMAKLADLYVAERRKSTFEPIGDAAARVIEKLQS
jgi:hypothetical protein